MHNLNFFVNPRPLHNSNIAKVSIVKWSQIWIFWRKCHFWHTQIFCKWPFKSNFKIFGYARNGTSKKIHFTRTIKKCLFEDILFLGAIPNVIPIVYSISNLNHEGVKLLFWIFFLVDQCTKRHNKNHQPTSDDFNKNWHTLVYKLQ